MKKAFLIGLCCLSLTGCAENSAYATPSRASIVTTVKSTDIQTEVQMERTTEDVTTLKAVNSTVSIETTPVNTSTVKAIADNIISETQTITITKPQVNSLNPTPTTVTTLETSITMTSPAAITSAATTSKPKVTTTTAKQTTAARTTTITVTTATQPSVSPSVVDMSRVSDQMWVFLTENGIAYDEMYAVGAGLHHDGTDYGKAKAVCEYAYNSGGQNCIEYALNAYFLAEGAGLECYIARSSLYDWYGHVGNVIRLDGKWYYMEPMSNITGSPQTYATGAAYPDGLDIVTDIYENRIQVTISDEWYN